MDLISVDSPAFVSFLTGCQKIVNDHRNNPWRPEGDGLITAQQGPRYIRVVRQDGACHSAHCFVDRTTGDVLKPAGWKGPAKHSRGNILRADNGLTCMGPYGTAYLR